MLALLTASVAQADVTPAGIEQSESSTGISETKMEPGFIETLGKTIGINYYGLVNGPSIGETNQRTTNLYSSDQNGNATPMNLYNEFRLDIKTGKRFNVRLNNRFDIYPTTDSNRTGDDSGFVLRNFRYGIVGLLIDPNAGGFSMASSMVLELPTSQGSQAAQMLVAPRISLNPNVDLPGTRWSLGAFLTGETFFYLANNPTNRDVFLYFGPYANYRLTDNLQATFQIDASTNHRVSGLFAPDPTDIQLGVNWDVSKKFSFNPFVQIFPENISLRSMFLGANISATFL
ncbi:MAG: hypothetical protein KA715_12095 [Xanthomonadaceae bacterium]|nr:hypothetical protein [Xanthomonadaceae bacterium]